MSFQLALITGASSGLGKEIAYLLAEKKIPLFLTARDVAKLEELAKELQKKTEVFWHAADLSSASTRKSLITLIQTKGPDLIINNAGFGLYGEALQHPTEAQEEMLEVNGCALVEISIEGARKLIKEKRPGTIVNISSAAAFFTYPDFAVYAASKTFVLQFSKAFDEEVCPYGVRVLAACPGQIETNFRKRASKGFPQNKDFFTMPVRKAAKLILKQIEKGKTFYIFDWKYRLAVFIAKFVPQKILLKTLRKSLSNRYEHKGVI